MDWQGMTRWNRWLARWGALTVTALLVCQLILAIRHRKRIVFWPNNPCWTPNSFSDRDFSGGTSKTLASQIQGSTLTSSFMLSDATARYAGIFLNSTDGAFKDCSGCGSLRVEYRTHTNDSLRVQILLDTPGRTLKGDQLTKRYLYAELPPTSSWKIVTIPLSDFQTPEWWFKLNFVAPGQLPPPDYSRLISLGVCESEFTPPWKTLGVDLRSVVLEGSWHRVVLFACLVPVPLLIQWLWGCRRSIRSRPCGQPGKVQSREDRDFLRITELIAREYSDPGFTLSVVNLETRISETRISKILEKRTGLHFKPYLNQVRINEAIRLLLETDLTVSEIAFQVGYSSNSHFGRVFKSLKQLSPGEFRRLPREPET